ncbi:MAG: TonB-dependent receptor, partial [Chthoniobacterales bacterium]
AGSGDLSNNPTGLQRGGLNGNSQTFGGRVRVNLGPGALGAFQAVLVNLNNSTPSAVVNGTDPNGYRNFENNPGEGATDPSRFNFRDFTPSIPGVEKGLWYATGRYKIFGDGLQIYGDVLYAKTKQGNGVAASPFTSGALQTSDQTLTGVQVVRVSPFNPFGRRARVAGEPAGGPIELLGQTRYRFHPDEIGSRRSFYDSDYWRYVIGLNGDFSFTGNSFISHFGYDTGFVYERYDNQRTDSGDADARPLADEIVAGNFNPFIGQTAQVIGIAPIYNNTDPTAPQYKTGVSIGTAPYDNRASATRASYLGHTFTYESDWLVDAKVNAHLLPNLWNGGIDVALGYEHRESRQHAVPDPVQVAGFQLGFNAAPNTKFRQEVESVFGELTIPFVVSTMNIPFVRSFEVSVAARFEQFDNFDLFNSIPPINHVSFDNGTTPRVSLRYQPTADLTLRANWNQSFRSPTPAQLFTPTAQNFPVLFDPLKFVTLQPPGGVFQQGNPNLQPESTDAYSAGLVYTPHWLSGFTVTADLYQLYTTNVILPAANFAQILLTANGLSGVNNGGVPTVFTADVIRDAAGNLQQINNALTNNAGKRLVEGIDITAAYEFPTTRWGTFNLSLGYNHFFIWKAEGDPSLAAGATNFLGNYNNGTAPLAPGAIPFNKGFLRGEWQWKGFDFVATGNYIGDFEDDPAFILGNQVLGGTIANPDFALHHRVSDYETLDMQLSYEFIKPSMAAPEPGYAKDGKDGKSTVSPVVAGADNGTIWQRMLWNTKVTVGVNNVFDRYPPTVLGAFNDNYDTSLYSIRNRYWYVSLTKKF